jgi:hypothetical protein
MLNLAALISNRLHEAPALYVLRKLIKLFAKVSVKEIYIY